MKSESAATTALNDNAVSAVKSTSKLHYTSVFGLLGSASCNILLETTPRGSMSLRVLLPLLIPAAAAFAQAGRGGAPAQPPLGLSPQPAIANVKPVRSCESLVMVVLPDT